MTDSVTASDIDDPATGAEDLLPIREVVRLTGVNPVTLRAWERRYGLIRPLRTEGGHRLYSREDVDTIRRITAWTERGIAVSKVGELLERGRALAGPDKEAGAKGPAGADDPMLAGRQAMLDAIMQYDELRLAQLCDQLAADGGSTELYELLLMPVWAELLQAGGFGQRSQWLFFDAFLRARLARQLQLGQSASRPGVLVAPLAECYELELLVTALQLDPDGLGVRILAPTQPLDELPLICDSIQPRCLVLLAPAPLTESQLRQLTRLELAIDCPVALTGVGAELSAKKLRDTPIAHLGSRPELMRQRLRQFIDGRLDT